MSWFDTYLAYDDDTLAALANPGLVRRAAKDVEGGKIEWIEQHAACGMLAADGQRVEMDARGPQHARCDCPAPGICKHIIAAVQWLRGQSDASTAGVTRNSGSPAEPPPADPLAEILALQASPLFKAAGVAAMRRAATIPAGVVAWHAQGTNLVIELPDLGVTCRWVFGAGFAGMLSELPQSERKALHLLALAAVREANGSPLPWPGNLRPPVPREAASLGEQERAFLAQVESTLQELLGGGLAHVSQLTSGRLLALNMSARGEGLPRLAALLRNLGGTVDLLLRRDHRVEERDALMLMARIHALCESLLNARGDSLTALRGSLRRNFEEAAAALELLPVGAHWWQTRGGARGLTLALWQPSEARLLRATLARPDASDSSFTRHGAWTAHALWSGVGTPERACEAALTLNLPRLAEGGRLSLGGATRAQATPMWKSDDPRLQSVGDGDWREVTERLRAAAGLADDPLDMLLLRPAKTYKPVLDEVRQRLDWLVEDNQGRRLRLAIPVEDAQQSRLNNLERLNARAAPIHAVLVRVARDGASTNLVPVTLLTHTPDKLLRVVSLDFANEPVYGSSMTTRILRLFEARRLQAQVPSTGESTLPRRLLGGVLDVLETQAATGRMPLTKTQAEQLREGLHHVRAVGLDAVAGALEMHLNKPAPLHLLKLAFISSLALELGGLPLQE